MSLTSLAIPQNSNNVQEINRPWRVFLDIVFNTVVFTSLITVSVIASPTQATATISFGITAGLLLCVAAVLAWRGRVKAAARLNMGILLFFFVTGVIAINNLGFIHALLAFGMVSLPLIHAGTFREEQYSYFVLVLAIIFMVGIVYVDNTILLERSTGSYRSASLILGAIYIGIIIYALIEQFNTYSLIAKFVISVLILAALSIGVTIAAVSFTIAQSATDDVVKDLQVIANSSALEIGEFIAREISVLEAFNGNRDLQDVLISANGSFNGLSEQEIEAQLRREQVIWQSAELDARRSQLLDPDVQVLLEDFDQFIPNELSLVITDQHGGMLATTGNPDQYYYGEEPWFFRAYAAGFGSRYISDPYVLDRAVVDPLNEVDIFEQDNVVIGIDIAIPLLTFPENRSRPTAVGTLRTTLILNQLFKELSINIQGSRVEELDILVGDQVLHLHDAEVASPEEPEFDLLILEEIRQSGFVITNFEGVESYVVGSSITSSADLFIIDNLEWTLLVNQPELAALSIITQQQRVQVAIGLVILLAGSVAALIVGRIVVNPILSLAEYAERIAGGERNLRVPSNTQDEIADLTHSFNQMIAQIEENERDLEQRVFERTRVLETSARIGRSLSTIVELEALISAVVEQIKQSFDYYHVHVYLPSKDGNYLEMAGGSGEIGQQLLELGHKIPIESGLVGRAAATQNSILEPDVSQAENWRPNDLLPETQAELAVPILLNDQLLGVLDIQNNLVNSLQQEDDDAVKAIAYQIAVAIQNAQRYEEAQREAAREQLINQINQKILSTSDMETAMKVALRELGQVLDNAQATVSLGATRENGHD